MAQYLYIISDAPYSSSCGVEALEAAIMGANFELDVAVLFIHDGVMQLRAGQGSSEETQCMKNTSKMFKALEDFGIESVFVDELSMQARMLQTSSLNRPVQMLDSLGVTELIHESDRVFTF